VLRSITTRSANAADLEAIRTIYNQGIEDRIATLDTEAKSPEDIAAWWSQHDDRYAVIVATRQDAIVGWASLNRFSHRCAHDAIADLSVYVARSQRGQSIGKILLSDLERRARGSFHKIVLHALNGNVAGKHLYAGLGFREVGVFREHGRLDGTFVDVVAMEKLLSPSV
jgi:L-amino acid N-acyltransferase YncA